MKIISGFKDYYDFVVGKYGIDPKIVYSRVPENRLYVPDYKCLGKNRCEMWTIYFCGKKYYIYYAYGDWFFGPGVAKINMKKYPDKPYFSTGGLPDNYTAIKSWKAEWDPKVIRWRGEDERVQGGDSEVNEKSNCPVIVGEHKNPRLSDFKFASIVPPETAFVSISNWLSREKPV